MTKITLLRSAAVGAVLTFGLGAGAHAADATAAKPVHHKRHHAAVKRVENPLAGQVDALKAEVAALEQRLDASSAAAQQAQAAAAQAQASAQAAQSASQAAAQTQEAAISQIPSDVDTAVAKLPKPANDGWYYKGVKFTPGGFIAAESVYRSRGLGSDFSVPFGSIPYDGASTKSAHTGEWRQTARQSRISGLAEANITPDLKLSAYGEYDFLGAAQTANSNESNSYNLRMRHMYLTLDSKSTGLSLLAGQTWSLVTLNDQGITPRHEVTPLTIDAQYAVGFAWARQPQVRLTENFGNGLWAAFSVETPQTAGVVTSALLPGYNVTWNQASLGGSLFNSANSYSFNHVPDLVAKVAYDNTVQGHHLHLEGFGLYRDFYDRVGTGCNASGACTAFHNTDSQGGGGGFGVIASVFPHLLDVNASGLFGKGVGRYGTSGLPDVFYSSNGSLTGINETMLLLGATVHATPKLDIYGNLGEERQYGEVSNVNGVAAGYGNPAFSNMGGCEVSSDLACSGNTKSVEQAVLGFWDKMYSGDFGSFKVGVQYSYTKRESFDGKIDANPLLFGAVKGDDNMIYTSIRYYPFNK